MTEQITEHYKRIRMGYLALMQCYLANDDFEALKYVTDRPCRFVEVVTRGIPAEFELTVDYFARLSPFERLRQLRRGLGRAPGATRDAMSLLMKSKGHVVSMTRDLYGQGLTLADAEERLTEVFGEIFAEKKSGWARRVKRYLSTYSPSGSKKLEELRKRDPEQYDVGQKVVEYMWEVFLGVRKSKLTPDTNKILGLTGLKDDQPAPKEVANATDKLISLILNPQTKEANAIANQRTNGKYCQMLRRPLSAQSFLSKLKGGCGNRKRPGTILKPDIICCVVSLFADFVEAH